MRVNIIDFEKLSHERTLRYDFDYHRYQINHEINYYSFSDLFEYPSNISVVVDELYDNFYYCEIGDVNKDGDISPVSLNFSDRNLLNENYYKKIENGNIIHVKEGDILIPKVRPNLKKYVFVTDSIEGVYFTSAFLRVKPLILPNIIYYCLSTVFYENIVAVSRQGKGYPTINEIDLSHLRFDKKVIDKLCSNEDAIEFIIKKAEKSIEELNSSLLSSQQIIDSVFQSRYGIDLDKLKRIDENKTQHIPFTTFPHNNTNCRFSYRWNKAVEIQKELIAEVQCCEQLGHHIFSTQNGWSPSCTEETSDYQVLGLDAIDKSGVLSFDNPKFSSEYKKDLEKYTISDGDFFVSRGNTTDLVALASVANIDEDMMTTIYPDLMIKIEFCKSISKMYMAYAINSFIGRLYFKYATKGKNQTMVKVSPAELNNFFVPIPNIEEQDNIVIEIQEEIAKQNEIKVEITNLRNQIHNIIMKTITT